ncbi:hypothetical protein [Methylobacterium isbiliense]|uniref:hypothetical protein n=1 Tax=Methylobacterium isbiliense TaxID=315478 RepID=UPI001EE2EBAC|nr:hypothetical protein [Methylobacterium isbiliense]MDN3624482.1 hypothetical protein [Methylobacterium isbiliense]
MRSDKNSVADESATRVKADSWSALELDKPRSEVIADFCARLDSVFAKYGCDPDEAGWRELAIQLLLRYEPAFRLKASDKKTNPNINEFMLISRLLRQGKTARQAAKIAAKRAGKNATTLEIRYSEAKNKPQRALNKGQLLAALEEAADELQNLERTSTNYKKQIAQSMRLKPRESPFS